MAQARPGATTVGPLLQWWRRARNLSQLALANEADVSPRHVCFIETGRTRPSREMVLRLADTLAVPLRERNALLLAAGFAPVFHESTLSAPDLEPVRLAIGAILRQQEPFPAVVMNRHWDIVDRNEAAAVFFTWLLDGRTPPVNSNVIRLMFHPEGLRPSVSNWEAVAHGLVARLHREAVGGVIDDEGRDLLREVLAYQGVPKRFAVPDLSAPLLPVLPVRFSHRSLDFNYFSAVTVLGTPQDITLQELKIEAFYPADSATGAAARRFRDAQQQR